jgi:hypothetical protein
MIKCDNEGSQKIDNEEYDEKEKAYLKSLNAKEYKCFLIAKSHLGSSFGLSKSIGFLDWLKKV